MAWVEFHDLQSAVDHMIDAPGGNVRPLGTSTHCINPLYQILSAASLTVFGLSLKGVLQGWFDWQMII